MLVSSVTRFFARCALRTACRGVCSSKTTYQKEDVKKYDIVIAGGGLVGSVLACALGMSPFLSDKKILVLESASNKKHFSSSPGKFSNRVVSIHEGTVSLFKRLGMWEKMCHDHVKEVKKIHVWECCSDAAITFQSPEMRKILSYVVQNDVILKIVDECVENLKDNVDIMWESRVLSCDLPDSKTSEFTYPIIKLQNGFQFRAKLLVGADGNNSNIRRAMKVNYIHHSYNQSGIVANLKLAEPTENVVSWQRFLPCGVIALLPVTDDMCSLVWSVSQNMCNNLMKQSDEEFVDSLNTYLWSSEYKIPAVDNAVSVFRESLSSTFLGAHPVKQLPPSILSVVPGSRASFPLGIGHATEYVAPRVALVGDSAHRIHPLAGQGVNLGFGDVWCLTECLEQSVCRGNDIGSPDALLEYEKQRQRHVVPFLMFTDALNRLYRTDFAPMVFARGLGFTLLDSMQWMKEKIMKHAST